MADLRDETVSYAVAERDKSHNHEGRKNIANVSPVDLGDLTDHHATNLFTMSVLFLAEEIATTEHTRIRVHPVAQGGTDAKMGAKNREMKKQIPVVMAVKPVRPPSWMPEPDSTNAVTGEEPKSEPMEIAKASAV